MLDLIDDGYCFVCGPKNPIGLKLDFSLDGKTLKTEFIPKKEHQGYMDIVHGGIISTLLDEIMVKLAIELGMPSVTAQMDIRLRKSARVGKRLTFSAEILENTSKLLVTHAKAVTDDGEIVAESTGKLVRVQIREI
ncbi:MAG: PaaI family thioesterase [Nitrospira sp.]|nr:PaaI family thioesterase [Nitrospira sp.]